MKLKLILILLLSLFIVGSSYAQEKKKSKKVILKGLVLDNENNPIPNATFFVDGKKANAISDSEGRFQLKLKPNSESILVFTLFNGAAELVFNGEEDVVFVMGAENMVQQDPLNKTEKPENDIVNVGYGSSLKRSLTSDVGEVDKQQLKNTMHYSSIYDMIEGEVPGVLVYGSTIIIRGISTVNGSSVPLFIVNGTPVDSISSISPNDVKSISILKGPSAAIYGARGSNGVILITLK